MIFPTESRGSSLVVKVERQLTVENRQQLKMRVLDALLRGEKHVIIDFSGTGYVDSAGLGVLVSLSKAVKEQGGELRLAHLSDDLKTLFELTKLDIFFPRWKDDQDGGAADVAPLPARPHVPTRSAVEAESPARESRR